MVTQVAPNEATQKARSVSAACDSFEAWLIPRKLLLPNPRLNLDSRVRVP